MIFFVFDIEPTIKALVIGYSAEMIDCIVGNLSAVAGAPVCWYVGLS